MNKKAFKIFLLGFVAVNVALELSGIGIPWLISSDLLSLPMIIGALTAIIFVVVAGIWLLIEKIKEKKCSSKTKTSAT